MNKKITSIVLALCLLVSCLTVCGFTSNAAVTDATSSVSGKSTGPQDSVQGSAILHCFDWSYNSIKANLKAIKDAGYTAVQTSPVQKPKDYNASWTDQSGQWWKLYQPVDIALADGNSWLGTKAELKSLCDEAEKLGIKVIVDIVANHLANVKKELGNSAANISSQVNALYRNDDSCWHRNNLYANDDTNRYSMTMGCIELPDLNTGSAKIQNAYKNLLIECIDLGVDGFRFDAAKHIELPTDSGNSSQFWPTIINGSQASTSNEIYYYGEILNGCATDIKNYTKYMSITDNYSGDAILIAANNQNAAGLANSNYSKGAEPDKNVLWVESHDTYMGSSGSAGVACTKNISDSTVVKAWAMVGSRANASALFFARPAATMGSASTNTTWKSTAVAEVNKFKNYFDGETEYLSSSGSIAYNERGTSGVVLVNSSGTSTSVNVTANKMKAGTYTDQITGNKFTVANGKISGQIGSTGVAVVYNAEPEGPSASVTPGSCSYKTDTITLTLSYNDVATSGKYSINGGTYKSFTNGQKLTVGSGVAYGTSTTVAVKASNATATSEAVTYTYKKVDPSLVQKVYFDNSSYKWSSVYAYIYNDDGDQIGAWPGTKMTLDSATGYYVLEVPENLANGYVIFTESANATTNRYPSDGADGMKLQGKTMVMKANHSWTEYTVVQPTTAQPTTVAPTTVAPTTSPVESILIGDVDLSGVIKVSDATAVQKYCADLATLTAKAMLAADVDKDGRISVKDATAIQRYVAGFKSGYGSCGQYTGNVDPTQPTTTEPVTEPTTEPATQKPTTPETYTLTFSDTLGWSNVYCYYWSDSNTTMTSWPGKAMTYSKTNSYGQKQYTVSVPAGAEYIIFSNGSGKQTVNIPFDGSSINFYAESTTTDGKYDYGTW